MQDVLGSFIVAWQPWIELPAWERAAGAAATALTLVLVSGSRFIALVSRCRLLETTQKGDSARLDRLHAAKGSTPTLGGVLIFVAVTLAALLWARVGERSVLLLLGYTASLLVVGFVDDWRKLRTRKGLKARTKLRAQIALSLTAGAFLWIAPLDLQNPVTGEAAGTAVFLPYWPGMCLEMGLLYCGWVALVTTASSNAVNLTDGLDGLATGSSLIVAATFIAVAFIAGDPAASAAVGIPHAPWGGEIAVVLASLVGAGLGFLWFNCHPARIFMGDTGSLPLGGLLGLAAVLLKQELLLVLAGAVLVAEALSVILQVISFKWTGKRIFLIAPLHHHFQFKGWPETRITARFWIAGAAFALAALLGLWGRA